MRVRPASVLIKTTTLENLLLCKKQKPQLETNERVLIQNKLSRYCNSTACSCRFLLFKKHIMHPIKYASYIIILNMI